MKKFIRDLVVIVLGVYIGVFGYYHIHFPDTKATTVTKNCLITEIKYVGHKNIYVYTFSELSQHSLIELSYSGKIKWFADRKVGELSTISWKESMTFPFIWDVEIHTSFRPFADFKDL